MGLLIVIPVIVLLYLLKQKAEDKPISSLFLWRESIKNMESTTPWEKFRNNLLMYLQIITMLALILALMGPYLINGGQEYKNVVVVIDNSGSMNTLYDGKITRLELSKNKAIEYIEDLPQNVSITVISCGRTAQMELTNSRDRSEVKKAIKNIPSTDLAGNLTPSVSLVASMAAAWESYEAVMFSDSGADLMAVNGYIVDVSSTGTNMALDYVSHRMNKDGKAKVLAKVTNFGQTEVTTDVNLYLGSDMTDIKNVTLAPGESKILYFDEIATDKSMIIKAEIQEKDDLVQDNVAYDTLGSKDSKKILMVTNQNLFLEKAIMTLPNVELYKTNSIDNIEGEDSFDLYIYDGIVPKEWPKKGNLIFLAPDKDTEVFQIEEKLEGVWVKTTDHSVTEYLKSYSFGTNELQAIRKPLWAESFLKSGEYSAGFIGNTQGRTVAVLAFDLHQSDLPLQTQFPILIHNLMEECLEMGLLVNPVMEAGGQAVMNSQSSSQPVTVTYPNGKQEKIKTSGGRVYFDQTQKAGLYKIAQKDGKETIEESLIVKFPSSESKLHTDTLATVNIQGADQKVVDADSITGGISLRNMIILVVFILLMIEWIVYIRQRIRIRNKLRRYSIWGMRLAVVALLLLALAGITITMRNGDTTTIFLVDVSDSVASHKQEVQEFIQEAVEKLPDNNKVAIVAFGGDTRVEQFVTDKKSFGELETKPITTATNLEQAVQAALALFPDQSGKRLVVITDGNENEGSLKKMVPSLTNDNVTVQVMELTNNLEKEVYVNNVVVPDKVSIGDTFSVEVEVESNIKTSATLYLYSGNTLKSTEEVELQTGTNQFVFKDKQTELGLKSYRVIVEAQEDSQKINNEYVAFTQAEARNTILLIEGALGKADEFVKVLDGGNISYERILAQGAPRSLSSLNSYQSVVMVDVYANDLPEDFLDILESYVKDYGGGFIAAGGENSFALGNYKGTSIETVLPVYMDLQGDKEIPESAVAVVIDHSGSMSDGNGVYTQLDLAKESADAALKNLREIDSFGVLSFDDTYEWVVPIQKAEDPSSMEDGIYSIRLGGGTSIYPALNEAYEKLDAYDGKIKHIILLTDGQDGFRQYEDLLEKINDSGITLSTVAVGTGSDQKMLSELADKGKGRYYYTDINSDIPKIFAKEVFLSVEAYLVNRQFTPIQTSNSKLLSNVTTEGLPSMLGYIAATKKELATAHLVSDEQDPILTTWQYGLGKTAAFNSDVENKWTANYASFANYPLLWKNLIQWTITDTTGGENGLLVTQKGSETHIEYEAKEYTEATKVTGIYTDEEGNSKEIQLEATAPGIFETNLLIGETGIYSMSVRQDENGKRISTQNTALAVQYSREYQFVKEDGVLEDFLSDTEGTKIKEPGEVFAKELDLVTSRISLGNFLLVFAVILFLLDIANRRLQWNLKKRRPKKQKVQVKQEQVEKEPVKKPIKKPIKKFLKKEKKSKVKKEKPKMLDTSTLLNNKSKR